jgi:hypothetical protein
MPPVDLISLAIVAGAGGLAGAVGGMIGGRTPGPLASFLLGALAGGATALILRAYQVPPVVGVSGLSVIYAALGGAVLTFAIAQSSGRA